MTHLKAFVIDDEHLARKRVARLLESFDQVNVVASCPDGKSALAAIEQQSPDVIFLDIEMPGMSGLEVIQHLPKKHRPIIVFITAYNQYAIQAFNFFALDYLLKPFTAERFNQTIERVLESYYKDKAAGMEKQLQAYLDFAQQKAQAAQDTPKIQVHLGNRIYFIRIDEIQYVSASGNYLDIQTETKKHILRETMSQFQQRLTPYGFVRIHKSYIINPEYLKEVRKQGNGAVRAVMVDGKVFGVSRSFRRDFLGRISGC